MKQNLFIVILLPFFVTACISRSATNSAKNGSVFRVLTYNVLTGFQKSPQQADRFVEWIKDKNIDVLALQELSTFTQDSLERLARRYGHPYAVLHKGNGSPIGITSKYPLTAINKISDDMHHGCIYAMSAGYHFFVTHLSPFSYEKCLREMKDILELAAKITPGDKALILGDFNSFSPADSSSYSPTRRYGVLQSLLDSGYTDSYRYVHNAFESSFPTAAYIRKAKAVTRIDYIFSNKNAARYIKGAEIIKDSITSVLSDHYPLLITFKQ